MMPYQGVIDDAGELVLYPDPFRDVTETGAEIALAVESQIVATKSEIENNFLKLAYLLDIFDKEKLYLARGYERLKDWCESREIELGWRVVHDLLRIRREVIPVLEKRLGSEEEAVTALRQIGISKSRALLPIFRDDENAALELVQRARDIRWRDVVSEVKAARGLEEIKKTVIFRATARQGETRTRVEVFASTPDLIEPLGVLMIRNEWMPFWEERFGKYIEYADK